MDTRKKYTKPELKTKKVMLGVFGDYNGDGTPGGETNPGRVKVIHPFEFTIE